MVPVNYKLKISPLPKLGPSKKFGFRRRHTDTLKAVVHAPAPVRILPSCSTWFYGTGRHPIRLGLLARLLATFLVGSGVCLGGQGPSLGNLTYTENELFEPLSWIDQDDGVPERSPNSKPFGINVGTTGPDSGLGSGKPLVGFETPTLLDAWRTAPYFHDGERRLSEVEQDARVAYLRSLEDGSLQPVGTLSAADASAVEAAGATVDFVVTLSARNDLETTTVEYAAADGTATAGEGYTTARGTLTFEPGETAKTVSGPVLDDSTNEGSETFSLQLSNPLGATLANATATGVIVDESLGLIAPPRNFEFAAGVYPTGLWSDGETLWVSDWTGEKVAAYNLVDGGRVAARDVAVAGERPSGVWSDGDTLWVAGYGDAMVTAVALEMDSGDRTFTALPVFPVDRLDADRAVTLDFARFANGDGITSELVFVNRKAQPSRASLTLAHGPTSPIHPAIYFYDTEGALIAAESVVDVTGGLEVREDGALTVRTEMAPLGVLTIATHGRGDLVTVLSDGPIGGMLRFDLPGIGAAVAGASPPRRDVLFPVRRQAGGINTEVAIHNLELSSELVRCDLLRGGVLLDSASFPLAANGHTSGFIDRAFPGTDTSDFTGSVRCSAVGAGLFSAVAVEMDAARRIFTTLPMFPVEETTDQE